MRPSTVALAALFITPISTTPIYEPNLITRHSISSAMPGGSRLSEVSTQDTDHNTLDPWQRRQLPSSDPESNGTWQRRDSEDEDEEEEDDDDDDEDDDDEKDFLDEMAHAEEDPALADAELAGVVTAASLMLILLIAFLIIRYRRRKHSKQNVSSEQHAPETTSLGSSLISLLRPLEPSQTGPSQTCSHSNQSFEKLLPVPRVASINHLTPEKPSTQPPSTAVQECSHTGQPIKRMSNMQAVFDFEPSLPDELPLRQGDTVRVEHLYGDGWALGAIVKEGAPVSKYRVFPLQACTLPERQ